MSQWKRTLLFLILNILVSVGATLTVLWFWERAHPAPVLPIQAANTTPHPDDPVVSAPSETPAQGGATPASPAPGELITIEKVVGFGNLADEYVLLKRKGEGELNLKDWRLQDSQGDAYIFPEITLFANGAVQVHSSAGANTVVDLYWGNDNAVWKEGEIVTLMDNLGNVQATYRIP